MHFCSNCSNMYYIRIDAEDPNKLVYYCRNCGNEDKLLAIQNVCVSKTQIKQTEHSYDHIINKYTKLTEMHITILYNRWAWYFCTFLGA